MTVTAYDVYDEMATAWQHVGDLLVRGQARTDARLDRIDLRLDRLESDVSGLKSDVSGLKVSVAENTGQLYRLDAKVERLLGYFERDERKRR